MDRRRQACCTAEGSLAKKAPPRVTADKEEKVGTEGAHIQHIYTRIYRYLLSILKLTPPPAVDPSDLQLDWAAGLTAKRKRGRKPKALMGVNTNRSHHKDGSERQEVREERTDSESSERGELQYRSHTQACSRVRLPANRRIHRLLHI